MRSRILAAVLLMAFAVVAGTARADNIAVQNNSFEQTSGFTYFCGTNCAYDLGTIPGWTTSGSDMSFEPGSLMAVPNGTTMALINGTLTQDLGVPLVPGDVYTLSVFVGNFSAVYPGSWSIGLDGGSTVMCTNGGATSSIAVGSFVQETCSFTAGATSPGDLTVVLGGSGIDHTGYLTYADFDEVSVTQAPEPGSAMLLGAGLPFLALFGVFYKRKQGLQGIAS